MSGRYEVLVAGAGVAGLCAALFLARTRHAADLQLCVVEAGPEPVFDPTAAFALRVSAVSAGSVARLEDHDAWQRVAAGRAAAFDHMRVWDAAGHPDGASTLRFDADEFAVPHLGYIVENDVLRRALLAALSAHDVDIRFDTVIEALDFSGDRLLVSVGGDTVRPVDLVLAADGAGSPLRQFAGLPLSEQPYRQAAFVAHFETTRPHRDTAWQRFLSDGPIGILPLADGRVSVVRTTTPDGAEALLGMDDDALGKAMTLAADGVLGDMRAGGPRGQFPLVARHARQYVRRGFALLGDAAHSVHPLAGQGANLGIADAAVLADVIDTALGRGEHPGDKPVLRRYERSRKGENAAMLHFMTGLNRLFASDSTLLGELRRSGMAVFNRSGPIRKAMAGIALGGAAGK